MPVAALRLPPNTRLTRSRRAVLDAIASWDGAFTVVELFDRAREAQPRLGLATTYRTVELLRRAGSLHPLHLDGRPVYVRCGTSHHHHLVCVGCGSVQETELCAAPPDEELRRRHGFAAQTHELDIYGLCARCVR